MTVIAADWNRDALVRSLADRARTVSDAFPDADEALQTARAYLALLVRRRSTPRPELHRAARVVRAARLQARWLAATALALHARAQELSQELLGRQPRPATRGVQRSRLSLRDARLGGLATGTD